jgi:hypothetical protein
LEYVRWVRPYRHTHCTVLNWCMLVYLKKYSLFLIQYLFCEIQNNKRKYFFELTFGQPFTNKPLESGKWVELDSPELTKSTVTLSLLSM